MQRTGTVEIKDGKIISGRGDLKVFILSLSDGIWGYTFKKKYKQRSISQNNFYWGVFLPSLRIILYDEGYVFSGIQDLHEWCKDNFNRKEVINEKTGDVWSYPGSTVDENTVEFEAFMERIRFKILDMFSVQLPFPNDVL